MKSKTCRENCSYSKKKNYEFVRNFVKEPYGLTSLRCSVKYDWLGKTLTRASVTHATAPTRTNKARTSNTRNRENERRGWGQVEDGSGRSLSNMTEPCRSKIADNWRERRRGRLGRHSGCSTRCTASPFSFLLLNGDVFALVHIFFYASNDNQ